VVSLAAVAMLHAAIVVSLIVALQMRTRLSSTPEPISAAILLSTAPVSSRSSIEGRPPSANPRAPRIPVEPMSIAAPEFALPSAPGTSIDWDAEAARAAAAVASRPKIHEFGQVPEGAILETPHSTPAHQAGDQYRDLDGWIVWVSDRCYLVSGVPPLGVPDVIARSIPTRAVCQDDSKPSGGVFSSGQLP
jgi:hypothetical protein